MAAEVKGIPDNSSVVIPRLVCRDPGSEIDFCVGTFDAVELGRRPGPDGGLAHENQFWGDRIAWLQDPSGHVWTIATRVEETTAEERDDRWSSIVNDLEDLDEG